MGNFTKYQTKQKLKQKNSINLSYIMLINSLKKNNKEIERELNNLNNNEDLYLNKTTNFFLKKNNNLEKKYSKLDLKKIELEELISNKNYSELDKNILLFLISKLDKHGLIKNEISSIQKEFEILNNTKITGEIVVNNINKLKNLNSYGIGCTSIKDFVDFQINKLFVNNIINNSTKLELLKISKYIKHSKLNYAVQKYYSNNKKNVENKINPKIIKIFLSLNIYPIENNTNIKNTENEIESIFDKKYVDVFINSNNNGDLEITINGNKNIEKINNIINKVQIELNNIGENEGLKKYKDYVKNKLEFLKNLKKTLLEREKKLFEITSCIVLRQKEYLLSGNREDMKPLILKDIAEEKNMPISTISRIISNKLIQTDFDIFPLKNLFMQRLKLNQDITKLKILQLIKEIIEENNEISDNMIVKELKKRNINIARRTVSKYRGMLHIENSYIRNLIK